MSQGAYIQGSYKQGIYYQDNTQSKAMEKIISLFFSYITVYFNKYHSILLFQ